MPVSLKVTRIFSQVLRALFVQTKLPQKWAVSIIPRIPQNLIAREEIFLRRLFYRRFERLVNFPRTFMLIFFLSSFFFILHTQNNLVERDYAPHATRWTRKLISRMCDNPPVGKKKLKKGEGERWKKYSSVRTYFALPFVLREFDFFRARTRYIQEQSLLNRQLRQQALPRHPHHPLPPSHPRFNSEASESRDSGISLAFP